MNILCTKTAEKRKDNFEKKYDNFMIFQIDFITVESFMSRLHNKLVYQYSKLPKSQADCEMASGKNIEIFLKYPKILLVLSGRTLL